MTSSEKYYVEKLAQIVRAYAEKAGINISKPLKFEAVKEIIERFGGKVIKKSKFKKGDNEPDYYIKKVDSESFEIHCLEADVMKLLHELGHRFFGFEKMEDNGIRCCDDIGLSDQKADLFARAFVMPRNQFENDLVHHLTDDGKFDLISLAEEYQVIDYMQALARGEDLNLWN